MDIANSLKVIEELPPNQRSSRVGGMGIINDLRKLPLEEAVKWLSDNVSSPVSVDWGRHLNSLKVDWIIIKQWLKKDKIHALAAADALYFSIIFDEELPKECNITDAVTEIKQIYCIYKSPRIKNILETVEIFVNPPKLTKEVKEVAQILVGPKNEIPAIYAKGKINQWSSLIDKSDGLYCLLILDWKATNEELKDAIHSLPVFLETNRKPDEKIIVLSIDRGNDEIILIAHTAEKIEKIIKSSPKRFKFNEFKIEPDKEPWSTLESNATER